VRIRGATAEDLPDVAALSRRWAQEGITWGMVSTPASLLGERLGPCFQVAEDGDGVVGYAFGRMLAAADLAVFPAGAAVFELQEIYVTPDRRGGGIGGALLDAVLAGARAEGARHSLVYSATRAIEPVMRFYAAHGFLPWSVQMFRSE